jgi:hypothetical protein
VFYDYDIADGVVPSFFSFLYSTTIPACLVDYELDDLDTGLTASSIYSFIETSTGIVEFSVLTSSISDVGLHHLKLTIMIPGSNVLPIGDRQVVV